MIIVIFKMLLIQIQPVIGGLKPANSRIPAGDSANFGAGVNM